MNKLNLRKRILLGYLVPLLLMLSVAVAVFWCIGTFRQISDSLDRSHTIMEHVRSVQRDLVAIQRSTRGYILFKNDSSRKNYLDAHVRLKDSLQILQREVTDQKQQENLNRLSEFSKRMEDTEREYFDLVDAGKVSRAMEIFRNGKSIGLVGDIDTLANAMEQREAEIVAGRHEAQDNAMSQLIVIAVGATALAIVLALVLGWWIATRISQTIVEAVAGLSTSSTEIAATVDEHQRVVTQQAAAVNETTSTVEELGASSRQSATQAESMAEATKKSLEVTQDGIRLANQVSVSMVNMKQKVGSVAEQILRLSEQAGQIGGIARVVGELAGETNMLALNAAVEAARAGEHGKGFAVVAAEIRKLADQSKKSAERTNALVAEIQKATNSAVMVTEEGSRTAEEVAGIIDRTIAAFGSISTTADSVAVSAQQVLLNSRQQASALGQVTEAMQSLSAGSAQMAAGTEQTKTGVQKLNRVAQDLQAMV
ncbi:MAG: methyl-accepting chemotaxis protein [Georgfuchsia sp.]